MVYVQGCGRSTLRQDAARLDTIWFLHTAAVAATDPLSTACEISESLFRVLLTLHMLLPRFVLICTNPRAAFWHLSVNKYMLRKFVFG